MKACDGAEVLLHSFLTAALPGDGGRLHTLAGERALFLPSIGYESAWSSEQTRMFFRENIFSPAGNPILLSFSPKLNYPGPVCQSNKTHCPV